MSYPFLNPISPIQLGGTQTVPRDNTYGVTYSINNIGGYMEVFSLSDLIYTIPTGTTGSIEYSGNTIPIEFLKGSGILFSPDVLTLGSDNMSSGRRRLGMLVYVYEVDRIYQYRIDNYDTLWSAATGATGTVVISDFGTTVNNSTVAGQNFINAWTANTIEDVSGYTHTTAVWKKYTPPSSSGVYLPLSGGTVYGDTYFTSGLTATTISATTYQGLPYNITQSTSGTTITGGPSISITAILPANTITNSEATIEFISKFFGAGGTGVGYLYVNTSNTLLGASLLATGSASFAATGFGMLARTMNYTGGTIKTLTASANFPSDYTSTGVSSVSFNPAVTNYFMFTVSGGPAFCQSYRITIY
jgi:hypothetical protein